MRYTISILAYQNLALTKRCIESVMSADWTVQGGCELILTDNACSDGTAEYFDQLATGQRVHVIHNAVNEGFIPPNIKALEMAKGEFFVMLNNDAEVPAGWLDELRRPFDIDPMMGLTGPEGGCCGFSENIQGIPSRRVEYVEGACVMGRVSVLRKVGLFSPHLRFAYWEDTDLSLRLRELGYNLKLVPFRIKHQRGSTSRTMPELIRQHQFNNGQYIRRRWFHYMKPNVRRMDYVTVIRRKDAWGDVLLTTPVIRALKQRSPLSPIWVDTNCADVFYGNPHVEHALSGIKIPSDAWVIDLNMAYENRPNTHFVAAYAEKAGLDEIECRTELFPSATDREFAQEHLDSDVAWTAVHVGPTTWHGKNWPIERWQELIRLIGGPVVLIGSAGRDLHGITLDLRGRTTPLQMAAVLSQCRRFVGLDSFPIHVAQAVGCPVVGLFGVTLPEFILTNGSPSVAVRADHRIAPSAGTRHSIIGQTMVHDPYNCMMTISVDQVIEALKELGV